MICEKRMFSVFDREQIPIILIGYLTNFFFITFNL